MGSAGKDRQVLASCSSGGSEQRDCRFPWLSSLFQKSRRTRFKNSEFRYHTLHCTHQHVVQSATLIFNLGSGNNVVNLADNRPSYASQGSRPASTSSKRGSKRGSYWPDPNPTAAPFKPTPSNLRDSSGNLLAASSVPMGSPSLGHSDSYYKETGLVVPTNAMQGRISSASSATDENDDYEAINYEKIGDAYSSGIPASVHELPAWSPVGNTWSGPMQRQLRSRGSSMSDYTNSVINPALATSSSKDSSIPSFPMPNAVRHINTTSVNATQGLPIVEHPAPAHFATTTRQQPPPPRPVRPEESHSQAQARDYFGPNATRIHEAANTDVSWLNLGADEKPPAQPHR